MSQRCLVAFLYLLYPLTCRSSTEDGGQALMLCDTDSRWWSWDAKREQQGERERGGGLERRYKGQSRRKKKKSPHMSESAQHYLSPEVLSHVPSIKPGTPAITGPPGDHLLVALSPRTESATE